MSFGDFESSRNSAEKIYLYEFFPIENGTYRYTNSEFQESFDGHAYRPAPITHGALNSSGSLDKSQLEIRMTIRAELAELFRVYPPNNVVNVVVRHFHKGDAEGQALVCWVGRIVSTGRSPTEMTLTCEPISTSMRRTGLRRHYQLGCPHVLYGNQCRANREAATVEDALVINVNGASIRLSPGWLPENWPSVKRQLSNFVGGLVEWSFESENGTVLNKRTILRIVGNLDFMLSGPATGLRANDTVKVILGCNHQLNHCTQIHNNARNFGGQPFIPKKNPFGFTNQFY